MPDIRYVKPVATDAGALATELRRWTASGTRLTMAVVAEYPDNLEYQLYETVVAPGVVAAVVAAERDGCDAAIVGCFYDTGLDACREVVTMPVVAPCESALHISALLGTRSAIVVGREKWIPRIRANVASYGFTDRVASYPVLDIAVPQLQRDREHTYARLRDLGDRAMRDELAEVLILGCTLEFGFADRLQDELGVPVIDAARAALKYAELAAELARIGWQTSDRGGYSPPSVDELTGFGLAEFIGERRTTKRGHRE